MTIQKTKLLAAIVVTGLMYACKGPDQKVTGVTIPDTGILNPDTLSKETALQYVKNYAPRAGTVALPPVGPGKVAALLPDSRCVYYSTKKLRALVNLIESEGGRGVRFYFGSYDAKYDTTKHNPKAPKKQYWGYNTVFMVSTKDSTASDGTTLHVDYFSDRKVGGKRGIVVLTDPENRGEICPPPSNCYTIGAHLLSDK